MNPRSDARLAGAALVGLAAVCFATLGAATRFAADAGVEPLPLVTWRAAIGAVVVGAVVALGAARGRRTVVSFRAIPPRERAAMAGGVLAGSLVNLGVFMAFVRISIALALLIFYLYPTLVAVISALRFGERFDRLRAVALGASLLGLALVLAGGGGFGSLDAVGVGFAFLAALSQTFYVLAARHGFASIPAGQAVVVTLAGGAVLYLGLAAVGGTLAMVAQPLSGGTALAIVAYAGTIGAAFPTLAFIVGIRLLGPPRAAILATLEPVVGVLIAALLLAEIPTPLQLVGGALVVAGAIVSQLGGGAAGAEHEAVVTEPATPR